MVDSQCRTRSGLPHLAAQRHCQCCRRPAAAAAARPLLPPCKCDPCLQKLTPEEFLQAGDYLVHTCPTWAWEGGDAKKAATYLPPGKQYLITRNGARVLRAPGRVSCMPRRGACLMDEMCCSAAMCEHGKRRRAQHALPSFTPHLLSCGCGLHCSPAPAWLHPCITLPALLPTHCPQCPACGGRQR